MNILIYGNAASGKTLLAELLQEHYEREGQPTTILDDMIDGGTSSRREHEMRRRKTEKLLERTLHNPAKHIIITTQGTPPIIYRFYDEPETPALFDYYYRLERKRPSEVKPRPPEFWGMYGR
jgi:adenylate kinase family enzyme